MSDAAAGEDVEAEVAAAFDPFVVLFGQDAADQTDQGVLVGEYADDVDAPLISRLSRSEGCWTRFAAGPP